MSVPPVLALDVRRHAAARPLALAVRDAEGDHAYAGLDRAGDLAADGLQASGIAPGDRVALLAAPPPTALALLVGILRVGAIAVPLGTRLTRLELGVRSRKTRRRCSSGPAVGDAGGHGIPALAPAALAARAAGAERRGVELDRGRRGRRRPDVRNHRSPAGGAPVACGARGERPGLVGGAAGSDRVAPLPGPRARRRAGCRLAGARRRRPAPCHALLRPGRVLGDPARPGRPEPLLARAGPARAPPRGARRADEAGDGRPARPARRPPGRCADPARPGAARGGRRLAGRADLRPDGGRLRGHGAGRRRGRRDAGSAGRPLPGVAVRIAEPGPDGVGEIQVRSPALFSGYLGREAESAAAITPGRLAPDRRPRPPRPAGPALRRRPARRPGRVRRGERLPGRGRGRPRGTSRGGGGRRGRPPGPDVGGRPGRRDRPPPGARRPGRRRPPGVVPGSAWPPTRSPSRSPASTPCPGPRPASFAGASSATG